MEKARKADFFKNIFEAPVLNGVPERPCPPDRPAAYAGPTIQTAVTWTTLNTGADYTGAGFASRSAGMGVYFHQNPEDNAQGAFLQASLDSS